MHAAYQPFNIRSSAPNLYYSIAVGISAFFIFCILAHDNSEAPAGAASTCPQWATVRLTVLSTTLSLCPHSMV